MKRLISIAIVAIMLSVSFAVGVSISVQGGTDYFNFNSVPWNAVEFTPMDIAWDASGSVAVVVGTNTTGTGHNAYVYDYRGDTWHGMVQPEVYIQPMNGVCWDGVRGQFWLVGKVMGGETSSVYSWAPGAPNVNLLQDFPLTGDFKSVATDQFGNPMVCGAYEQFQYLDIDGMMWHTIQEFDTPQYTSHTMLSIDYNTYENRFYAVGESDAAHAGVYYSDPVLAPLNGAVDKMHLDMSSPLMAVKYFSSIDWNPVGNYSLVVGSEIWELRGIGIWDLVVDEENIFDGTDHMTQFNDVSWDTDGYGEAAIVGQYWNLTTHAYYSYYWNYIPDYRGLREPVEISQTYVSFCVGYKPPGSPKFPMIPLAGGGVVIMASMSDQTTRITANAVFPKMYWIGFNDTTTASRLEQSVPLDSWYNFTVQANYSEGWTQCEIIVEAWYDWGAVGDSSNMPSLTDGNRDLAFSMSYDAFTGTYGIIYPTGNLEVTAGAAATDTDTLNNPGNPTESHHVVEMPIYLGAQIRNATGNGFGSGGTYDADKNVALNDAWSWDFEITVRDRVNTAGLANMSAEFGIDETVSILASGNPAGNAPPGSGLQALSNPSIISYSANTDYWVNVSIPNLYLDGNPLALDWINCDDVYAQNVGPNVTGLNSDLFGALIAMPPVEDTEVCIWGQGVTPIGAPSNGTNATGPYVTNFNAGAWLLPDYTQVNWGVDVQAATPEGVYWAIITITIGS